jgi:hypothetical protein
MSSKKGIAVLGFVLAINAPGAIASPPPAENDGDPVLNNVEYWMQRWGALVGIPAVDNASPTPQPILAWTANTYVDTDSDGIPDVVEMLFTHTDPAVRDDVACAGGGSPDLTGQYEVRRAANLGTPVDFLADELSAISVCHTSNSPGGIRVFEPRMGYATSASISGSDPYTLTANWTYLGTAVAFTGDCPSPCTGANIVVTGSLSIGGALAAAEARRRATAAPSAASVNGLYAGQVTHFPHQAGASPNKLQDLGSGAIQINYLSNSRATVYTKETYEAYPAYYSALTGTVFYTSFIYYADAYKDPYDPANSNDDTSRIALMLTEAPVSGVGGRIRGSETGLYTSPGQAIAVTENQIYGKASLPNTGGITLNRSVGIGTLLYLNNVPVSADAVTVSGPAITTSTIWSDLDTDYFNDRSFMVRYGVRIPGFTDGEKVGLASDGTSLEVSSIYRLFQSPLANNTYAFNFSGAEGGFGAINVPHTNRSSTPLPVVTNVQLDGSPLTAGRQKSLTGEDLSVDRVLSWSPLVTGGINGNGAGLYRVIITDPFHGVIYPPASITVPSPDSLSIFVDPADPSNPCPSDCSVTIKGGTLANSTAYRIEIEARDKGDPDNRSLTDRYYLNTKPYVPDDFNLDHTNDILWQRASDGVVMQWLMAFGTYTSANLGGSTDWSVISTAGDFNDDGRADILWRRSSDGAVSQWLMSGSGVVTTTHLGGSSDWSVVKVGDFNGDGKSDILWRRVSDGMVSMWLMDGSGPAKTANLGGSTNWNVIEIGDFNGDGKTDMLWRRTSDGAVTMWLMNGTTPISTTHIGGSGNWSVVKVGDFNGDGKTDILWRRASDGTLSVWLMNGILHTATNLGGSTNWNVIQVGDFNGDGKSDILLRRTSDGTVVQWLMNGASYTSANLGGSSDWSVAKVGDYDSDGKADILWRRASDGLVSMWLMDGPSHTAVNLGLTSGWSVVP